MTSRLRAAFLLVPVLALVLAGCAVRGADTPAEPTSAAPDATESSETESSGTADAPAELTFAAGDDLDAGWQAQWGDSLVFDDAYTLSTPDDGNGNWGYTDGATQCTVDFWQGRVGELGAQADDSALSDAVLAAWYQTTVDKVTPYATDDTIGYQVGGAGSADVRAVFSSSADAGTTTYTAARGIQSLGVGMVASVTCPAGQDAQEQFSSLRTADLTVVVGPSVSG